MPISWTETFVLIILIVVMHKPGRNDPCPCGSGKKAKKCCGTPKDQKRFSATVIENKDKTKTISKLFNLGKPQ
jgi:hypothetical protein